MQEVKATDEELKRVYEDIPSSYDRANRFISFNQDVRWRADLVKTALKFCPNPLLVLDVASGKGELTYVFRKFSNAYTVMMDYSENMLKGAVIEGDRVQGSFDSLPFRDNSFDMVMSSFALHASDDVELVIREMDRVSRHLIAFIAMGKPDSPWKRAYVGFYLHYLMPYIAMLGGAKPQDYRYIYYIFRRLSTNLYYKTLFSRLLDIKVYREMALNLFYFVVAEKRER
ncbi:Ubiquinone/menaquinone biosynthesis C-methyltransferase UbiE [Metallosphaera sp. J1]|uniref:class I SAM-dependent methyltransferase n=1 Tax=Metallosphaera javensis (ex Hofmann et al. 2022) TaxID=99938 RepID=UPI001EDFF595|nr:class I SAM-dependent methyltransferase [Metallosphaera javensis (ex Hofmann et al. 2022)]MCG3109114.1 Ubiquinone/menaquinone biosynthesis C-methyltransferase UbiE [Metallosphaera javensis (ex Hofmann et al. 2022)]